MLTYKDSSSISHKEAERIFASGIPANICDALLAVVMNDNDWKWSQTQCLHFLNHDDSNVRGLSATCLGHIACIHHKLDQTLVISALEERLNDPSIRGQVSDALDDIHMFIG